MAKRKSEVDQGNMFPDLDPKKPDEKALIAAARKYLKISDDRAEALDEAKEREDTAHDALVEHSKFCQIEKFTLDGRTITIEHTDKVKVKAAKVKSEDGQSDGESDSQE